MSGAAERPRVYRGRTVEELLPRIHAELGADAIVLARREGLAGGLAGFFQRPFVEIEAVAGAPRVDVYDEPAPAPAAVPPPPAPTISEPSRQPTRTPFYEREPSRPGPSGAYVTAQLAALAGSGPSEPAPEQLSVPESVRFSEHVDVRESSSTPFSAMLMEASAPREDHQPSPSPLPPERAPARARPRASARARERIERQLIAVGMSGSFAAELVDEALAHVLPLAPGSSLARAVRAALVQRIPRARPLPASGASVVLVGPGGAGKTSCAAALLGAYRRGSSLPASCATLVRGSAREELRMLLSPYVMSPIAIDSARALRVLRRVRAEGLLIVDTPAISPAQRDGARRLAALLGALAPERVAVALPATLGAVASAQLLHALRPLGADTLALTHARDTDQIGVALEAACRAGLAPEYRLERARSGGWLARAIDPTALAETLLP